ncbi:exo-beta-N-acetylmuramidase NamZ family protein [Pseudobacteriovorax antillogorgiicola]|uniref:Uncharacterized conserved protein YbbC, DUF1343 family n=1 Tax=Pseudobacteriovorax antillogorgiicola TaxID=1513793 RepID=A0A1Y6B6G4_9BACT|nr:DUF1343 domain-containing protein [Pseudobacteriovorax antillogorgiicola]TCS59513.1 uncharacterized protein YbbC (DUF1343 family) [Pseudobacteriovorax antillogorgiicola]SME87877.1 Uncharacterized conserved protein YbbC, DUF1343 family [Pseudobacteriovorax antillogorgiicola]
MKIGLEKLRDQPQLADQWGRCALLCNQASVTRDFKASWDVLRDMLGDRLVAFFGPQHGFHATLQDNMIESNHGTGPYGLPVYSLYSETREPTAEMLAGLDTIVIDIQIVGCRVYTFKYTIAGCLRAAKKHGKRVVVLDRSNPLGGVQVEGNVLDLSAKSFVGEFEIPLRHGLTPGEAAQLFNLGIGADLEVIAMDGWRPDSIWQQNPFRWVLTSPNLPTTESLYVYPATVMFEGTNVSEGRGTGLPFQFIGAPFLDRDSFTKRAQELYADSRGVYLRPADFQPTSQKWAGTPCSGLQIHVLDPLHIDTFRLGLSLVKAAIDVGGDKFQWSQPPYEYDYSNLPINLILGHLNADQWCRDFDGTMSGHWRSGLDQYLEKIQKILLYERDMQA